MEEATERDPGSRPYGVRQPSPVSVADEDLWVRDPHDVERVRLADLKLDEADRRLRRFVGFSFAAMIVVAILYILLAFTVYDEDGGEWIATGATLALIGLLGAWNRL
jgi:hypothetical protein